MGETTKILKSFNNKPVVYPQKSNVFLQCLEKNNSLKSQNLGTCCTEKTPWRQMGREVHEPAGHHSRNRATSILGCTSVEMREGIALCFSSLRLELHPLWDIIIKRKTLMNCSYSSGGPPRWSKAGARPVVLRPRELGLFILKISFQGRISTGTGWLWRLCSLCPWRISRLTG